ncbi:MAG TPA: PhzF family phenazine biosynthesis protein [Acidimicrobiales bacterium]|nr:PhzF family phenazine biosynthesis protein [Acidimicrobiales bacterium]
MADYYLLDVFTTEPFAGNPLAVFVDQDITDDALMQRIARELNLSETVFVSTGTRPFPTRIFTPGNELPFAGHPTVGTAVLLHNLGHSADDAVVLAEAVGDVRVTVHDDTAEFTTAKLPARTRDIDRGEAAAAIGVTIADLDPAFEPAVWDCGVPWPIVAVRDADVLARAHGVPGALDQVYVVVSETPGRWRARSFAPGFGIPEDPATGSAVAAFAGFVARLEPTEFTVVQGVEMGRPSELRLTVARDGAGALTEVRVAGEAVVVGGGALHV